MIKHLGQNIVSTYHGCYPNHTPKLCIRKTGVDCFKLSMQTCSSLDCIIAHFSIGIRSCTFTIIHGHDVHPAQLYSGLESTLYRIDAIQGKPGGQHRKSQPDFQGLASFRSIGLQLCKHQRPAINHRLVGKRCSFNIKINPSQTIGIDNLLISSLEGNFIRDHFSHLLVGSTTKRNINIAT